MKKMIFMIAAAAIALSLCACASGDKKGDSGSNAPAQTVLPQDTQSPDTPVQPEAPAQDTQSPDAPTQPETPAQDTQSPDTPVQPTASPLVDWSDGFSAGALGGVIRNPDEYYQRALEPVFECDASGGDPYAETILLYSMYEGTKVVLRTGTMSMTSDGDFSDNWEFVGEEFISFSLGAGKYAIVRCTVPEGMPAFAVEFLTDLGTGTYIVGYDGTGDMNKPEYVFADEGAR